MSTGTRTAASPDAASADVPRGLKGVVVTDTEIGDVRGGEGFYHYRQYSAVDLASEPPARGRVAPDGRRAPARRTDERHAFAGRGRGRCGHPARPSAAVLPAIASGRRAPARRPAHRPVAVRPASAACVRSTTSTPAERRPDALLAARRHADAADRAAPAARAAWSRSTPRDDLDYAANYLYMLTGEAPSPGHARRHRAVPHLHRRPRVQRVHLHRPGHRLHRRRHGGLPRRRHRRPLRAAARRGAEPGARPADEIGDARPRPPGRGRQGGQRASGSWASATPSTAPRTRAR